MPSDRGATPAGIHQRVSELLSGGESVGVALEKARTALLDRERIALELLSDGLVDSRREALLSAGYSERTARSSSAVFGRLRVAVVRELEKRLRREAAEVTTETYRDDLVALAHADPSDAYDDDGKLRPLREWPAALRRSIKRLKLNPLGGVEEVTFEGRAQVLSLLGKHKLVGAFETQRTEVRKYIIRDYTGGQLASGSPADGSEPVDVTELAERVDERNDLDELPDGVRVAAGDIDRGSIPLRDRPERASAPGPARR